ncbi:hypothetical protein ACFL0Z_00150 [Patescibacteria group bacterium]
MPEFLIILQESLVEAFATGPFVYVWFLLGKTWWLFTPLFLLMAAWWYWVDYINTQFIIGLDFRLLAITVPKDSIRTPKSMELIFAATAGMMHGINMFEKYWKGNLQEFYSAELVGINGHIRYIFRVPDSFRDLFEANIYGQYPEAEIMEVEDYSQMIPNDFLEKGYKAWGTELQLLKEDAYPIRTYPDFEERITQEVLDPMGSITELMSRLSEGEQLWIQWLCRPVLASAHGWVEEGEKLKDKLMNQLPAGQRDKVGDLLSLPVNALGNVIDQAMGYEVAAPDAIEEGKPPMLIPDLYNTLLALDRSLSKQGFEVKCRVFYVAKKDTYLIQRGITGFFGYIQHFNTQNLNGFRPDNATKTKVDYFLREYREYWRKRKMLDMCQTRSFWKGGKPFILTTEEIATVFHFPMPEVKAKTIERVDARKGGAPKDLPIASG